MMFARIFSSLLSSLLSRLVAGVCAVIAGLVVSCVVVLGVAHAQTSLTTQQERLVDVVVDKVYEIAADKDDPEAFVDTLVVAFTQIRDRKREEKPSLALLLDAIIDELGEKGEEGEEGEVSEGSEYSEGSESGESGESGEDEDGVGDTDAVSTGTGAVGDDSADDESGLAFARQRDLLDRLNVERAAEGRAVLMIDDVLMTVAAGHAADMRVSLGDLSHTSSDGRRLGDRLDDAGYEYALAGENIAQGQTSVDQVMDDWMASEGHRANIINDDFTHVGFARDGDYWAMVFVGK